MSNDVEKLGQVFTPEKTVDLMIELVKNNGKVLEPSCGDGAFASKLQDSNLFAIELDPNHCPDYATVMDFFDLPLGNKFDTIIGNPPYVAFKNIIETTREKLCLDNYDKRTNLFIFFIDKCLEHLNPGGEIIFVTPREFIKQTSAIFLNEKMYKLGTLTHFYDYGDEMLFKGFTPNCAVWRFERDNFTRTTTLLDQTITSQQNINGQIIFSDTLYDYALSDLFSVHVGGVSGLDSVFVNSNGNKDFVYSKTATTNNTRKMFYDSKHPHIISNKQKLINRKIKSFDEKNWWEWGRDFYKSKSDRVYVNCKTRNKNPFFTHSCKNYDGSVLALIPTKENIHIPSAIKVLNSINWQELGFKVGGRFVFSQKALQNIKLPTDKVNEILIKEEQCST